MTNNFKLDEFLENRWIKDAAELKRIKTSVTPVILANLTELAQNLQVLRDHLKRPISINIAFRPVWWELARGRSGTSRHATGEAADIIVQGMTPKAVAAEIKKLMDAGRMKKGGLSAYPTFTHYDIRGVYATW